MTGLAEVQIKSTKSNRELAANLRARLHKVDLETGITAIAQSGSCYIHFKDRRLGQIRIGPYNKRYQDKYRWQICTNITRHYVDESTELECFFYPTTQLKKAMSHIRAYYYKILQNQAVADSRKARAVII